MHETLKRLFDSGQATATGLRRAAANGWITPEQFMEITGMEYTPPQANKYGLTPEQNAAYQQEVVNSIVGAVSEEARC